MFHFCEPLKRGAEEILCAAASTGGRDLRRRGFDRRRFLRVRCHNLVRCRYINEHPQDWVGNLSDLSEGGLRIRSPRLFGRHDIVQFVINFARLDLNITVAAHLAWTLPHDQNRPGYVSGFAFLDIQESQQAFLRKYVEAHLPRIV
ncbi:MAG: PilZ domain-containing protein [Candidatus Omnitrophota bacterium]